MIIIKKIYIFLSDIFVSIIIAGSVFVLIYGLILRPFQVNGDSMYPTYHSGEYVLTNLISLRFSNPDRGDVVIFHSPKQHEKDYIKRVIGLPNDIIMLKNGDIYVNGKKLLERYLPSDYKTFDGSFLPEEKTLVVPDNMFFVLGDNRNASSDSREWGFVKKEEVIGKAIFVYWPIDRLRFVSQINY